MPAEQIKPKPIGMDRGQITEFEVDDGQGGGEEIKNGLKMQFHADPTGAILSEKPDHRRAAGDSGEPPLRRIG